jgi:hypothetical protein
MAAMLVGNGSGGACIRVSPSSYVGTGVRMGTEGMFPCEAGCVVQFLRQSGVKR